MSRTLRSSVLIRYLEITSAPSNEPVKMRIFKSAIYTTRDALRLSLNAESKVNNVWLG